MSVPVTAQQILRETNQRIYQRNLPSVVLQPYLPPRPVAGKQSVFPVGTSLSPNPLVNFRVEPVFQPCTMFSPGDRPGVWSGYATNVETEHFLRSPSIPSSQSDLYQVQWQSGDNETRMGLGLGKHNWLSAGVNVLPQLPREATSGALFQHSTRNDIQPTVNMGSYF